MTINTGTGGFRIEGQTYDFDVGDPDALGLDPTPADTGDVKVDNSVKDISKKTKTTLAQYLKNITARNEFPNDGVYKEVTFSDSNGVPEPLPTDPINNPQFSSRAAAANTVSDSPDLRQSTGTIPDPATTLSGLSKGKTSPQHTDGNTLLSSVGKNSLPPAISGYTNTVLNNNRFTDASRAANFDVKHPDPSYDPTFNIPGRGNVKALRLAQVGAALSLRASQVLTAGTDGFNPSSAGAVAAALLPSANQLGLLKVTNVMLEANDVLDKLSADEVSAGSLSEIAPFGGQSWGALNNVEEPFDDLLNVGQIALSLALVAAVLLLFEGLGLLISLGSSPSPGVKKSSDGGLYKMGSSTIDERADPNTVGIPPNLMSILGLHGTFFPFGDALQTGAAAFFLGASNATSGIGGQALAALSQAGGNALSDTTSAGFNIVVARTIVRSGLTLAQTVSKIGKAFASNPVSGVKSVLGLLRALKESKIVAAINVFTVIGDAILSGDPRDERTEIPGEQPRVSTIDALPNDSPGSTVQKNRLQGDTSTVTKLAWASNRAPAMYLLPDSVLTMQLTDNKLGAFRGAIGLTDPLGRTTFVAQGANAQTKGARIPRDSADPSVLTVKQIESQLDAEYVPFYFHDLRTNEIVSFHAFLASITDDYTANYESVDGYGRVDPIKIYKSTGRRVGLSFYVAATSKPDFDDMWVKINKLVTLVYPQYTKGRTLTDGQNTFIQPFSQLIGASPLIRIRLGDLLKSNYSRFALARLFGADTGEMQLDGNSIAFSGASDNVDKIKTALAKLISDPVNGKTYFLKSTGWSSPTPIGSPSPPQSAQTLNVNHGHLSLFEFIVAGPVLNGKVPVQCVIARDLNDRGMNPTQLQRTKDMLDFTYGSGAAAKNAVINAIFEVPPSELVPTPATYKAALKDAGVNGVDNIDKLADFLDDSKNALVRSFKSVKGKGLAGVIETMSFDWYEHVTWETELGSAAPKLCKVTIGFSPIHDISPGIDHLGYNRAPVYAVGDAMNGSNDVEKEEG